MSESKTEKLFLKQALRQIEDVLLDMEDAEDNRKRIIAENEKRKAKGMPELKIPSGEVRKQAFYLKSTAGLGKTSRIQQMCDYGKKYGLATINCGRLKEGQLGGMPVSYYDKDGNPHVKMTRLEGILPDPNDERIGILFFDELGNAELEVRKEFLEIADGTKREGELLVPKRWIVVGAGNTDDMIGEEFIDLAFQQKARFRIIEVTEDLDDFIEFMNSYEDGFGTIGFSPVIKAYLSSNPQNLAPVPDIELDEQIASPRNWENVNQLIRRYERKVKKGYNEKESRADLGSGVRQYLGKKIGMDFMKFFDLEAQIIKPEEILTTNVLDKKNKEYINKLQSGDFKIQIKNLSFYNAIDYFANEFGNVQTDIAMDEEVEITQKGKKKKMDETDLETLKKRAVINLMEAIGVAYEDKEEYIIALIGNIKKVASDVLARMKEEDMSSKMEQYLKKVYRLENV